MLDKIISLEVAFVVALSNFFSPKSQKGVTMIEYALIAGLVAVAAVVILGTVGTKVSTVFTTVSTKLP
jgi:pilus assembly protein Flp/PilA